MVLAFPVSHGTGIHHSDHIAGMYQREHFTKHVLLDTEMSYKNEILRERRHCEECVK